ncbi:unnamed protein product [Leptidea sinapis]|uniref:SLC26A/SulP transporter domain-containing protein n=1 Tax=Leptidea sinapis TaxID=189913 RepID=A0A5E4QG62_9NEOP|nr:unnamed protein product [Leptidea sinapis]
MWFKHNPKRLVGRVFPIAVWARTYDMRTGIGDLIAGITVALTLIPQSIAYAALAGFEPQYGLYASLTGGFVYGVMGTVPQINIGPTALLSLLTFTYTNGTNPDFAILLCFIGGVVQLIAGVAQLGFLVEYVSTPVVSGFTSAAALTIASSQMKSLLGLQYEAESFMTSWSGLVHNIGDTKLHDALLGLVCCIVLMGMKVIKEIRIKKSNEEKASSCEVILQRSVWFAGVSRNAFVVVLASVVAFILQQDERNPFILTGHITPGLPRPEVPPFHSTVGNATINVGGMFSKLGSGLLIVPLVGVISNVAIAKAFSQGKTLDATQEIISLGICNIVGSFFRSFPVNGSFTRSAVSDASGVRTPAAGFYTSLIVLFTLWLLAPYFYFIPRAALAAVIVCAVLHMVDIDIVSKLWKTSRLDLIPLVGTFVCGLLLGVEVGLGCGVAIDALLILYYQSRPKIDIRFINGVPSYYTIRPQGGLYFASAEAVRSKLASLAFKHPKQIPLQSVLAQHAINSLSSRNIDASFTPNVITQITPEIDTQNETNIVNLQNAVSLRTERQLFEAVSPKILVIYCDALSRLDYTFLQSSKEVVNEWSQDGIIIWCDVKPMIRKQLATVLQEPIFCDSSQLPSILIGLTTITHTSNIGDTHL